MQRSSIRFIGIIGLLVSLAVISVLCSRYLMLARADPSTDAESLAVAQKPTDSSSDPCSVVLQRKKKLDATEAIRLAECFIAQNGYTDVNPTVDQRQLAQESVDPGTDELGMRMRRDSLERNAYGYARGARLSDGWTVLFRKKYKAEQAKLIPNYEERIKKTGRAVTMDAYGRAITIEHQDFYLDFPGLKKPGQ
jgi:hypothetical protein